MKLTCFSGGAIKFVSFFRPSLEIFAGTKFMKIFFGSRPGIKARKVTKSVDLSDFPCRLVFGTSGGSGK